MDSRLLTPDRCEECLCFRDPDPYPTRCEHPDTTGDADLNGESLPEGCGLRVRFLGVL